MKLYGVRILFVLGLSSAFYGNFAEAATVGEIASYRGTDRQARLEKGAKAEGEFVWYTSVNGEDIQRIVDLFEKQYPFIKTKAVRLTSARMVQRYTAEYQAGTFLADILDTNDVRIEFFRRKGMLQPYYSPMAKSFDKRFVHPQGFWLANRVTMIVLGFNNRLVKPSEAPQHYDQLLDPKWQDKMSLEQEDTPWFMALMWHWGEQKGKSFFQKLRAQQPKIRVGHTHLAQLITAGEDFLSPTTHSQGMATGQRKAAPVDWVNLEPVVGMNNVSALAKNAAHPHAAMLFLDFMLTKDGGQRVIRDVNRIPTHPEVLPNPPRLREGFEFIIVDPVKYMDTIDHYNKLWREWVLQ